MSYKKTIRKSKYAMDCEEFHTARYGAPGQGRTKRKKPTPEQMAAVNRYNRTRKCRWRIRLYFDINDCFVCLTYRKEERPEGMKEAKEDFRKFVRKLRKAYKKAGKEFRWMRNIECGKRNAWHIHLLVNRIPDIDILIREYWPKGTVRMQLLYSDGEFRKLAAYITKTPETDNRLKEADYSSSRNMPLPDPEEKIYRKWKTWGKVRIPAGWYLDKETLVEGTNPITGYRYRRYTLLKVRRE